MSNLKSLITPSALLAAFTLAAAPSFAQQKYHGRESSSGQQQSGGQAREQAQPRGESGRADRGAAPRAETRAQQPQQAPRQQQQAQPRQQQQAQPRQVEAPRAESRINDRRNDSSGVNDRRNENNRVNDRRDAVRGDVGRAVPRVYAPRYEPRYSSPRYAPRYTPRGYGYYGSRSYSRPYVFRPRFSIGFGIYAGFPVPYTYSYSAPIWVYGYRAPRQPVFVTPGSPYYGGVALEMTPYDADVFVDGTYAGRVEDFDGATQPLTLTTGVHEIEVQAQGYEPMRMNVEVQPGQVIPYRGDLRPY
jgi:PEGA domain-containing protein